MSLEASQVSPNSPSVSMPFSTPMQVANSMVSGNSFTSSNSTSWQPTSRLLYAEFIKPFLPLNNAKLKLTNKKQTKHFKNLYPGDSVYIFEILKNENPAKNWARGYTVIQPLPSDFSSASVDIKKLPDPTISVSVFPLNCVKIIKTFEISNVQSDSYSSFNDTTFDDTAFDDYDDYSSTTDIESVSMVGGKKKPHKPVLPLTDDFDSNDLTDEIKLALKTLTSTLFVVYAKNNFEFFKKLIAIYNELDDIRIYLLNNLLTKNEEIISKRKVTFLMNKFAKLLSSSGGLINRNHYSKSDIDGKESILARDESTAELFQFPSVENIPNPARIAQNQVLCSLSPNYPLVQSNISFIPEKNNKFEKTPPSNILVDFKQVVSTSTVTPKGYDGMKAYMYLRNTKKRLTEAFSIEIRPGQDFQLDNLAAALFTSIPASEIGSGRIYLVALLTETIKFSNSSSPTDDHSLNSIRKGICAGVADITRIFSRRKGHLISGKSHRFVIKLFSSFLDAEKQEVKLFPGMNPMMAKSMTMVNNGWGELVDRIISGSSKGVAVNPRAEKLILSIKELRLSLEDQFSLSSIGITGNKDALACVKTLNYNPLEKDINRIYLRLIRINNISLKTKERSYLSVRMSASSSNLTFAKGSNEKDHKLWNFLSVSPEEYMNELITVRGLTDSPTNENDYLILELFLDGHFIAESKYLLRAFNRIYDTGIFSKKTKTIEFLGPDNSIVASVEIDLEVVGKTYNLDTTTESILNWKKYFGQNLVATEKNMIAALSKFKRIELSTLAKFFPQLCFEILSAYHGAIQLKLKELQIALFETLVHLLDITIARNQEYVYLFDNLINQFGNQFPKIGEYILSLLTSYYSLFERDWNATGRALCRVSILVLKISEKCIKDQSEFRNQGQAFAIAISKFLSSNKETIITDQLLVIDVLELYLDTLKPWYTGSELIEFARFWIEANKLRGLGSLEDPSNTALMNKKKVREHTFIISKIFFISRLLNSFLIKEGSSNDRQKIIYLTLDVSLNVLTSEVMDIECSRLALGILLSVCNTSFGKEKIYVDNTKQIYMFLIKSIPLLTQQFMRYYNYCKINGLIKPKRTFTQLFPNSHPFEDNTMDSIVNDVSFAEILVEFSIIIIYISKMFEIYKTEFYSFISANSTNCYSQLETTFNVPSFSNTSTISTILQSTHCITTSPYYPRSIWLSLHSISIQGSYLILQMIYPFLPLPTQSTLPIWQSYITTLIEISTSKPSSIEHLAPTPRKGSYQLTTDLRTKISPLVLTCWDSLGEKSSPEDSQRFEISKFCGLQINAISTQSYKLLEELMLLCMQRHAGSLSTGVKMMWCVIASELTLKDGLFELEKESVSALYDLFEKDDEYSPQPVEIQAFVNSLQAVVKRMDSEDESVGEVSKFVKTLSRYLASLAELKRIPNGEEFDDDRTFHSLNISSYLMNVDRPELFQSFICDMHENNLSKKNYVQAALSLELLANSYDWDINTYLPECIKPKLPSQTAFKRKSDLFKIIASNFVKGNKLEQAVDIYSEMLDAYMKVNFELTGLSLCHSELGKLYGALENVDRLESTFFKISFIGFGFPDTTRGKEFVYEGLPYEHITSINHRLSRLYPGSRIISNEEEAKKLLKDTPFGKYLHIRTVSPRKELTAGRMSFMAKQYVDNKNLNTFVSTRRLPGSTSIANLWTEEITYRTYMTFPTLMNRSEIKTTTVVKIPPVKNAIRSLMDKNEELSNLEFLIHQNLKDNISLQSISSSSMFNNLSRILAGTVDSPVNGGAGEFRLFFKDVEGVDMGESVQEYDEDCKYLKECFNVLITLLDRLLKLHGLIIPETLHLQHESLIELIMKNFKNEIQELHLDVSTPLDYDILMQSLTSTNVHSKHRTSGGGHTSSNNSTVNNVFTQPLSKTQTHTSQSSPSRRSRSTYENHNHHRGVNGLLVRGSRNSLRDDSSSIGVSDNNLSYMMSHNGEDLHSFNTRNSGISGGMKYSNTKKNILNYK